MGSNLNMQGITKDLEALKKAGNAHVNLMLEQPKVDLHANQYFPVYNPAGRLDFVVLFYHEKRTKYFIETCTLSCVYALYR